jgi:hypothetical protein
VAFGQSAILQVRRVSGSPRLPIPFFVIIHGYGVGVQAAVLGLLARIWQNFLGNYEISIDQKIYTRDKRCRDHVRRPSRADHGVLDKLAAELRGGETRLMSGAARDLAVAVPVLETERLRLRAHRADDHAALSATWADPLVYRFLSGQPTSPSKKKRAVSSSATSATPTFGAA